MKIILIEQVDKLGTVGDTVNVKSGYARNYLLPHELALRATKDNIAFFAVQKDILIKKNDVKKAEAKKVFDKINEVSVNVIRMASDEGKLFGSVSTKDVAAALTEKYQTEFKKSAVIMGNAIREAGIYPIKVRVHPEYIAVITLCIAQNEAAIKQLIARDKAKAEADEVEVDDEDQEAISSDETESQSE
ncbi:MAG: 50S ribosomal protein L9 [Rickettsiales bacterium]|nr:50S ribosomal protein L9 [Rickettsiales bacterium]